MAESRQSKRGFLREQGTLNPRPQDVQHEAFRGNEFFDADDLLQVKYEMLRLVEVDKTPINQAAKAFGLSRSSFYQAQDAFEQGGLVGLLPQKRAVPDPDQQIQQTEPLHTTFESCRHGDSNVPFTGLPCLSTK